MSVQNVALFDPADVVWDRVSERLITMRRLLAIGMNAIAAIAVALVYLPALTWTWRTPILVALLALSIWEWWLIGRQVRAIGYVERADDLLIRKGILFRELVVVPYGRMQFVDVQSGPVERVFNLAHIQLHTASTTTKATIPGLLPEEAARLRDRLATRGEAQMAGL
ncbi:MAG TPA: PH domain-containing protein [Actinomycetales bacterium]|nr:PH domain-containing protein [Actinomycetales bacterium]